MVATVSAPFAAGLLDQPRQSHDAERSRLLAIIDEQSREIALLQVERQSLRHALTQAESPAASFRRLLRWRDEDVADDLSDRLRVTLDDYQDDGSGRPAIGLDRDEIEIDLSDEDDFIPARLIATKELPDGQSARFEFRLQADSLRYDVECIEP